MVSIPCSATRHNCHDVQHPYRIIPMTVLPCNRCEHARSEPDVMPCLLLSDLLLLLSRHALMHCYSAARCL